MNSCDLQDSVESLQAGDHRIAAQMAQKKMAVSAVAPLWVCRSRVGAAASESRVHRHGWFRRGLKEGVRGKEGCALRELGSRLEE